MTPFAGSSLRPFLKSSIPVPDRGVEGNIFAGKRAVLAQMQFPGRPDSCLRGAGRQRGVRRQISQQYTASSSGAGQRPAPLQLMLRELKKRVSRAGGRYRARVSSVS